MKSNYKKIGDFIKQVKVKNTIDNLDLLLGINIDKYFMPSVANIVGTDLSRYKVVKPGQFACNRMHVGRDYRLPVALSKFDYDFIISPAYDVFEIIEESILSSEYLMMWFSRAEFDRNAWFYTDTDVRGKLGWDSFCDMELPVPTIEKQREIVKEYNTIVNRIKLNEQLNQKLEETAQAIYKHWFVDFEFPTDNNFFPDGEMSEGQRGYKSSGGEMVWREELEKEIPMGWEIKRIEDISTLKYGKMLDPSLFLKVGYPVFSGYGLRGYYSEFMYKEPQVLVLCRGVSGTGEVKMSPPKAFITNLSIVVEIEKGRINKHFLYFYLKNDNLRKLDSGSAQSQITIGDLGYHKVLVPPLDKQNGFGRKVKVLLAHDNSLTNSKTDLLNLQKLILSKMTKVETHKKVK